MWGGGGEKLRPSWVLILHMALKIPSQFPSLLPALCNYACLFILINHDETAAAAVCPITNTGVAARVTVCQNHMKDQLSSFFLLYTY